jgi:ribosomal protein S18 acetylase RimI-like enzyme
METVVRLVAEGDGPKASRVSDADFVVRQALASDAAAIAVLLTQLGYPADESVAARRIARVGGQQDTRLLVAETKGEIVGLAGVHVMCVLEYEEPVAVMIALVVREDQRRKGIARMLADAVEQEARRQGCDVVVLGSAERRDDAHRFYESVGYEHTGRRFIKRLEGDITESSRD